MKLIEPPATPLLIRLVSLIGALLVGAAIVYLVFTFGYYASGLAAHKAEERQRQREPIRLDFQDPNAQPSKDPRR